MCNEYARRKSLEKLREEFSQHRLPTFEWFDNLIPNDLDGKESVRISDTAPIVRLRTDKLVGSMTTWAWKGPHGKPVFNFVSERRDFSNNDRVLVFADGFYEFTTPEQPKVKVKDKHLFELKGCDWFWIAGIVKQGCFTLLTTDPGPDLNPYHDRQIVILRPEKGMNWLTLSRPGAEILRAPPAGSLEVTTVRRNGGVVAA